MIDPRGSEGAFRAEPIRRGGRVDRHRQFISDLLLGFPEPFRRSVWSVFFRKTLTYSENISPATDFQRPEANLKGSLGRFHRTPPMKRMLNNRPCSCSKTPRTFPRVFRPRWSTPLTSECARCGDTTDLGEAPRTTQTRRARERTRASIMSYRELRSASRGVSPSPRSPVFF